MAGVNRKTGRSGPAPHTPRDGDKIQARQRVNVEIRNGYMENPNELPCFDCGHVGSDRRHEYDHYLGYDAEHHLDVQPVCAKCHHARDDEKVGKTHCVRGHEFNEENTVIRKNGTRLCRLCRRLRDKNRGRDAEYWRNYKIKMKAKKNGENVNRVV